MGWKTEVVVARIVVVEGDKGGTFTYDTSGNLRTANVGETTTDPEQGLTCYAGYSTFNGQGAVISLFSSALDAQFWYIDTGSSSQGALNGSEASGSVATNTVTDPFGNVALVGQVQYFNAAGTILAVQNFALLGFYTAASFAGPWTQQSLINEGASGGLSITTSELTVTAGGAGVDALTILVPAAGNEALAARLAADRVDRYQVNGNGDTNWGPGGSSATDCQLHRQAANAMSFKTCDLKVESLGRGLQVREGANCKQGTAVANGTTAVAVATTAVTANSRIFLGMATPGGTPQACYVSSVTPGTGFSFKSMGNLDTSTIAWEIFEPA